MIIAGNCLYTDISERKGILETAQELKGYATHFRCKLWGGGTTPDRYFAGMGSKGLSLLKNIQNSGIKVGTEIQSYKQMISFCFGDFIWVGARNSQNYSLLEDIKSFDGDVMLKRGAGMTIDETFGIYDIMKEKHKKDVYIIERGINIFDRQPDSRWSPDLKGVFRIKHERPDIFKRLIVDCSHSVGKKEFVCDVYKAFKTIGVEHFMFECTSSGRSKTDSNHMLSVKEFKKIIED